MTDTRNTRPRAFRLEATQSSDAQPAPVIELQPDAYATPGGGKIPEAEVAVEIAQKRGMLASGVMSWGGLFWSAITGLVSLGISVWFWGVVENLFARTPALGWAGVGLAGIALLALLVLLSRELLALRKQKRIARLHAGFAKARADDDRDAARGGVANLVNLYATRAETAAARAHLQGLSHEIIDGRDLIDIAERTLMHPLDEKVRREIAVSVRRVSVVTAISPRALLDVLFVAAQAIRMTRRIAEIYGGRPGLLGFLRLARSVAAHLAITGGMAVGDSIVQQVLGHGIAARLSARLGEGVLNGLLTARVGLSAMAVCRPMPFAAQKPPGVNDVAPFLFSSGKS